MQTLDRAFAEEAVARLEAVPADAKPLWGELSRDGVISHLTGVVEYTLGRIEPLPDQSVVPFPRLIAHLLLLGVMKLPKDVKFKGEDGKVAPPMNTEGGTERLREALEEFIVYLESGQKIPGGHPVFGRFSSKQWLRFHRIHLDHHLRQFDA